MIQLGDTTIRIAPNSAGDTVHLYVNTDGQDANAFLPPMYAARVAQSLLDTAEAVTDRMEIKHRGQGASEVDDG